MTQKKLILAAASLLCLGWLPLRAQKVFTDWNGYVDSKNIGTTGVVQMSDGSEELTAQTYHYSGPGRINRVRVYGNYNGLTGVRLRVNVYQVDSKGRPTGTLAGTNVQWWGSVDNPIGYVEAIFSGGVAVSSNFAIGVALRTPQFPYLGSSFQVKYTGNGDGKGRDMASIAGTSTSGNWSSLKDDFGKDGDLYLVPQMAHENKAAFGIAGNCVATGTTVNFSNASTFTRDSMFNRIGLAAYSGAAKHYAWDFGDMSSSNVASPSHAYSSSGMYQVRLITTIVGWNSSLSDTARMQISVGLSAGASNINNATCNGQSNGSFSASGSGGATPYQYAIGSGAWQSGATFSGLAAGSYTVKVKDYLGCIASNTVTISQPAAIEFTSTNHSDATCGNMDGSILVSAGGGSGSIQYQLGSGSFQSSGSFNGLAAGNYTITAKDGNSCTRSTIVSVDNTSAPALSTSSTNVSCYGISDGSITLSASGGTGTHQFSINGGSSYQSSGIFSSLAAGTYQVQVKDAAGCTDATVVTIKAPNQIRFNTSVMAAKCYASSDGEIHLSEVSGGIGKPSFSINGSNYQSSPDFTGLRAGTYTVYVKDIASCIVTGSAVISRPTDISTSVSITNATCNGSNNGIILANATGGTPSYYYSLSGGSWQSSGRFETGAGSYQVMVMDNNGCRDTANATVGQPTIVAASSNSTNSTCGNSNGSILVAGSGGSGSGYQYCLNGSTWNSTGLFSNLSAGTYYVVVKDGAGCQIIHDVTVKDANGPSITSISKTNVTCNGGTDGSITVNSTSGGSGTLLFSIDGSNWYNSGKFTGLTAGTYTVSVKDGNGCIGNSAAQIISQPNAIAVSVRTFNATCNGLNSGQVSVSAIGGSGTLGYSIDGGQTYQSDRNFSGLRAGYYLVMVRDAGGCVGYATFSIEEPTAINIVTGVLDVTCSGASNGAVSIQASGGNAPYTYSLNGTTYQSSGVFTGMRGGTYTAYVKDINNCVRAKTFTVNEPDELFVFSYVSDVSCAGGNNGVIDLSVTGGVLPYTFKWSNEAVSEDIFNLRAGSYSVMVSDANGCIKTRSFTITAPINPIVVNGVVTGTSNSSGSIDITITGGVPPYTYNWSNGRRSEDISGLAPGVYSVVIRDANNCEAYSEFTVSNSSGTISSEVANFFRMHPNPAGDLVTLRCSSPMEVVRIYNAQGVEVFHRNFPGNDLNIPTGQWPAGTYLVHIAGNGQREVHKLVILH